MNYEDKVKALNKRLVATDSKAGAVKGEGLAVDLLVDVMFEDNNGDEPTSRTARVRSLNGAQRYGALIPDAVDVKAVKGEGSGTMA